MSQPMALPANTVATQTAPTNPVTTNSQPSVYSEDVQTKPTGSFGRILHDRMAPQTAGPVDQKEPVRSDEHELSGAAKAVTTDDPATEQTTTGHTLPGDSATVEPHDADEDGIESGLDSTVVISVAALSSIKAVVADSVATTEITSTKITPASALAAGISPGRSSATDPATAINASLINTTPGVQSIKIEKASSSSSTVLQAAGKPTKAPAAANMVAMTTTVVTAATAAQVIAAPAAAVVVAGGKDAGSEPTKSAGIQKTTGVSAAVRQQTELQTASGQDITLPQRVLSQAAQLQSTSYQATGSQASGSPGQVIPVKGQAGVVTMDPGHNTDTKNAIQQLAASLRTADQRFVSIPNALLTQADRVGTVVVDGSGAVPVVLSSGQSAVLSPLVATTASTVLTMPVGVQPGDPRWAQAFTDRVAWLVQGNVQAANIRLSPPELGQLDIRISLQNDQASILIASPHQTVRHALESTLLQLRQQFDNMGFVDVQAQVTDQQPRQRDQSYYTAPDSAVSDSADGSLLQPLATVPVRAPQGLLDLYI